MVDIDTVTGRELDALVAERVMNWRLDRTQKTPDGAPMILRELPHYSADPAAARGVDLFLEQRHPGITWRYDSKSPCRVTVRGPSGRDYSATDPSEATAICRAMVKAMAGEGPERLRTKSHRNVARKRSVRPPKPSRGWRSRTRRSASWPKLPPSSTTACSVRHRNVTTESWLMSK